MPPPLSIWPVLASRTIFVHPRLTLIEDTVRLPSGQETEWLRYADSGDVVAVICVDEARRVLVSFQYNPAPGRVVEEFPGGGIAPGETVEEGARRELLEEIGLYAHRIERIGAFLLNNRRWSGRCHVVVATELEERQASPDAEEFIAFEWFGAAEVEAQIRSGAFENGSLLAAWSLYRLAIT